jgi:hypothetical protein
MIFSVSVCLSLSVSFHLPLLLYAFDLKLWNRGINDCIEKKKERAKEKRKKDRFKIPRMKSLYIKGEDV